MKRHLNTLFIMTEDSCLAKEGESVIIKMDGEKRMHLPMNNLGDIVCFGRISLTQPAIEQCSLRNVSIQMLSKTGRFIARITGQTSGNVILRRQQYRLADSAENSSRIAADLLSGKIANCRAVLLRHLRDYPQTEYHTAIETAISKLSQSMDELSNSTDLDNIRGIEGDAAKSYFDVFDHLIVSQKENFYFASRNRRPPTDNVNALLSFVYAIMAHDAESACEAVGLDPQVGFLHRDRPGRASLALDIMEEMRPFFCDRMVLSLINRKQIQAKDFTKADTGAVSISDDARKTVVAALQNRKQKEILHPFLQEQTTIGLIVHLQARLLARHIRGELDAYPAFFWK